MDTHHARPASYCDECVRDIPRFKAALQDRGNLTRSERIAWRLWKEDGSALDCPLCEFLQGSMQMPATRLGKTAQSSRRKDFSREKEYLIYAASFLISSREISSAYHDRFLDADFVCLVVSRYSPLRTDSEHACIVASPRDEFAVQDGLQTLNTGSKIRNGRSSPDVYSPCPVGSESFDLQLVLSWLDLCRREHGKFCQTGTRRLRNSQGFNVEKTDHRICLVDCERRVLRESSTSEQYVALSYVWGSVTTSLTSDWTHEINKPIPASMPKTLEDAIKVVLLLGYKYIWIDQLCINQTSQEHKISQIRIMDSIYSSAQLTIIAAAGQNSDFGLPGVSSTHRTTPAQFILDQDLKLTAQPRRAEHAIHRSKWASRGWTYQEGVLASRRLAFTEDQVYFECRSTWMQESLQRPTAVLTGRGYREGTNFRTNQRLKDGFRSGYFAGNCSNIPSFNRNKALRAKVSFTQGMEAYRTRNLSFQSDILNAFQGYIETILPQQNAYGLPLLLSGADADDLDTALCWALCWRHDQRFPPRRRPGQPSFSWTGWTGMPGFEFDKREQFPEATFPGLDQATLVAEQPYPLRIDCRTSEIRLRPAGRGEMLPERSVGDAVSELSWHIQIPDEDCSDAETHRGPAVVNIMPLLRARRGSKHSIRGMFFRKDGDCAERIGYFILQGIVRDGELGSALETILERPLERKIMNLV